MTRCRFLIAVFMIIFWSSAGYTADQVATDTEKPVLTVLMREFNQPYVFKDTNGILMDIFSEAMPDFRINPVFLPHERGAVMISSGEIDAISIVPGHVRIDGAFMSSPYIEFHNQLIVSEVAEQKNIVFDDLQTLDLIGFVDASKFLGDKFAEIIKNNSSYRELADQEIQVRTFLMGRTDGIIIDRHIFGYFYKRLTESNEFKENTKIRAVNLFPPTPYCAIFKSEAIRDRFEKGCAALKQSGRIDSIISKYSRAIAIQEPR